jgi:SAM-dependent methyltransferase
MSTNEGSIYGTGEYLARNPTYHVEDSAWKASQVLKMLARHRLDPETVCEVGCGAGEILAQLQRSLPERTQFFGYEISEGAFALCQKRENERLHFYWEDLLAGEAQPFDLLICLDVFEHVEDYLSFLRRLRGRATHKIFHIPLDVSVQSVLRSWPILRQRERVGHLHYFTKETALATLRDTGYRILDSFYTPSAIDRPRTIRARIARGPRQFLFATHQDWTVRIMGGYSLLVWAQ